MLATDLKRLNEAYALKLEERINEIEAQNITKIGFIGEFSTGKTSLINSVPECLRLGPRKHLRQMLLFDLNALNACKRQIPFKLSL